jgi:hypothetical protein
MDPRGVTIGAPGLFGCGAVATNRSSRTRHSPDFRPPGARSHVAGRARPDSASATQLERRPGSLPNEGAARRQGNRNQIVRNLGYRTIRTANYKAREPRPYRSRIWGLDREKREVGFLSRQARKPLARRPRSDNKPTAMCGSTSIYRALLERSGRATAADVPRPTPRRPLRPPEGLGRGRGR